MRLTLQTLLAYLNDLLEPKDAHELGKKIDDSEFAAKLVNRIQTVVNNPRVSAPRVSGKGSSDPNDVAEYLDNTMPPERLPSFEKACLESDVRLAEVAASYQILRFVLGKVVDPPPRGLRDRAYQIGAQSGAASAADSALTPPGEAASGRAEHAAVPPIQAGLPPADHASGSPPVEEPPIEEPPIEAPPIEGAPPKDAESPEPVSAASKERSRIPDYLRDDSRMKLSHLALMVCLGFLIAAIGLRLLGPFNSEHPVLGSFVGPSDAELAQLVEDDGEPQEVGEQETGATKPEAIDGDEPEPEAEIVKAPPAKQPKEPAPNGDEEIAAKPDEQPAPAKTDMDEAPAPVPAKPAPAKPAPKSPEAPVEETTPEAGLPKTPEPKTPEPKSPEREVSEPEVSVSPPKEPKKVAIPPEPPEKTKPAPSAKVDPAGKTAPKADAQLAAANSLPPMPGDASPKPAPDDDRADVGRYVSEQQVLVRLNLETGDGRRVPANKAIKAGDELLALPAYRPQITLTSAAQTTLVGPARVAFAATSSDGTPNMAVEYGKILLLPVAQEGRIGLDLAGRSGFVYFDNPDVILAMDVQKILPPGGDPQGAVDRVVEIYSLAGRASWQEPGKAPASLEAGHRVVLRNNDAAQSEEFIEKPAWSDAQRTLDIIRLAATNLEPLLDFERSISVMLHENENERRSEVRSLAVRSLTYLNQFEPAVRALNDKSLRSSWDSIYNALRDGLVRSPEAAQEVQVTMERLMGREEGQTLFRMLRGYSPEDLENGMDAELVGHLSNESMAFRVLALENLRRITETTKSFRPEFTEQRNRAAVKRWQESLQANQIRYPANEGESEE